MTKWLSSLLDAPVVGADVPVTGLAIDSRWVQAGDVFCAYQGDSGDGHDYIEQAIANGAVALITEKAPSSAISYMQVPQLREKISQIAANFYANPSQSMEVIGITGTNGKTSISYYCQQLLSLLHQPCAVIGTLGVDFAGHHQATSNTTPDALSLQKTFYQLKQQQARYVAMEVSSHALVQKRCQAVHFAGAVFSNLSQDHLDYHATMADYFAAKKQLFTMASLKWAVLNRDDSYFAELQAALASGVHCLSYSLKDAEADLYLSDVVYQAGSYQALLHYQGQSYAIETALQGQFNLSNLLAALAAMLGAGFAIEPLLPLISQVQAVSGRMQSIANDKGLSVLVDYAHTPDALVNVLKTVRPLSRGQLIVVFGCGGDRDKSKRPLMAQAAEQYADKIIVTDDNPRTEASQAIIADIVAGFEQADYQVISDRAKAISAAIDLAQADDCVVLAGKGHENYQIIGQQKHPFDDAEQAQKALNQRLDVLTIQALTDGQLQGGNALIHSIMTDSRKQQSQSVFVALKGEQFDGHDFVAKAAQNGAVAALVERFVDAPISQIKVADSLKALGQIAYWQRQQFTGQVLALTGSSGKTSTCQMLKAILAQAGTVAGTLGNFNNDLGLPLSLLAADKQADFYVFEMGAAQRGDIARLVAIAEPEIAAITNIGTAHIGRFGSRDAIAEAKTEIFQSARIRTACINQDDEYGVYMQQRAEASVLSFSCQQAADVQASDMELNADGSRFVLHYQGQSMAIKLALAGKHQIANSVCAASMALAAGLDLSAVQQGLQQVQAVAGRLQKKQAFNGAQLIDDSYNANCQSVKAAIDVLAQQSGETILVLGEMAELGQQAQALHQEVGAYAKQSGIDALYACGELCRFVCQAFGAGAYYFEDKSALIAQLLQQLSRQQVILVKGSHSSAMDEVVRKLEQGEARHAASTV